MTTQANGAKPLHHTVVVGWTVRAKELSQRRIVMSPFAFITLWNEARRSKTPLHLETMLIDDEFVEELMDERSVFDAVREIRFCGEFHLTFGTLRKTFPLSVHPPSLL